MGACAAQMLLIVRVNADGVDGGALRIVNVLDAPANNQYCCYDPKQYYSPSCPSAAPPIAFRDWYSNSTTIVISSSVFLENIATCSACSGGAISIQPGGDVSIINCTIANNSAQFFGGGLFIGGPSPGYPSCSLNLTGSTFQSNRNSRSGGQLYSSCGGSVDLSSVAFELLDSYLEVSGSPSMRAHHHTGIHCSARLLQMSIVAAFVGTNYAWRQYYMGRLSIVHMSSRISIL